MTKRVLATVLAILLIATVVGCQQTSSDRSEEDQDDQTKGPITVASKIDTEGALLSQMIILMLRDNGFKVADKSGLGPTDVVRKALLNGEIDIYPEYTGNGGVFFEDQDPEIWHDAQKGFETVKKLDKQQNDVIWLEPAPANNTWAIAIRKDLAEQEDLETLQDFAAYVNQGGDAKVAVSEEFSTREDALPAFEETYGFDLEQDQLVILSGGNTAQTEKAAAEQTDGVNAAMAYGTDGSLSALDLVILEDNKGVQPVYEPAPIVRETVYDRYPELPDILDPVFESLDLSTLQSLNAKIAVEGEDAKAVARDYLESEGFLER